MLPSGNKGAAGIDGITIDEFVQHFKVIGDALLKLFGKAIINRFPLGESTFASQMVVSEVLGYLQSLIVLFSKLLPKLSTQSSIKLFRSLAMASVQSDHSIMQ
ncbi:hypothetical protein ACJJH9_03785 [Microbulbifer sp. DLAB2-AF]|uniref:hypothetical protein n=1 Tax=Microbulbifer sp. DLAB2-AF TaxID=3243395 RepID=UPI004039D79C